MNYYEVLGAPVDASDDELRHAYLAKMSQLRPERFSGAPTDVTAAVDRAKVVVEAAWNVLGDVATRAHYDAELNEGAQIDNVPQGRRLGWRQRHAEHVWAMERELGLPLSAVLGIHPPDGAIDSEPTASARRGPGLATEAIAPSEKWLASPLYDPLANLERIADWFAPHPKKARNVTVPNVCGMHAPQAFYAVAMADLRINFVRLTEDVHGDGVVVDQKPAAGASVRRNSMLTVEVVYSPRPDKSW